MVFDVGAVAGELLVVLSGVHLVLDDTDESIHVILNQQIDVAPFGLDGRGRHVPRVDVDD